MYLICTLSGMQMFYFLDANATHDNLYTRSITNFFGLLESGGKKKNQLSFFIFSKRKKKKKSLIDLQFGGLSLVGGPSYDLSLYCAIEAINS